MPSFHTEALWLCSYLAHYELLNVPLNESFADHDADWEQELMNERLADRDGDWGKVLVNERLADHEGDWEKVPVNECPADHDDDRRHLLEDKQKKVWQAMLLQTQK